MALFEEKYGDVVRVVKIGDFSEELCGGTHVKRTGQIGIFKIISEEAISAGVRRITALTGFEALRRFRDSENLLDELRQILDVPREKAIEKLQKVLETVKEQEKKIKQLQMKQISGAVEAEKKEISGVKYAVMKLEAAAQEVVRNTADTLASKLGSGISVVFNKDGQKVTIAVKVTKDLTDRFKAGDIAKRLAKVLGGGGGGRPDFAQAGGKHPEKIEEAIIELEKILKGE